MLRLAFPGGEAPSPGTGRQVNEWLDDSDVVVARAFSSKDLNWIDWLGLGVFAFSSGSNEIRVWPQPRAGNEDIANTFSRALQPIILQALGGQALHAAASFGPAGVLAFCGSKGSGKSTIAFAMRQAGWQQFSDDALVLQLDDDCVVARALPFRPRLRPTALAHFANARMPAAPKTQPTDLPLAAVFLLKQDSGRASARVSLISRVRAFSELLAHAHCFDVGDAIHTRGLVRDYLRVAEHVPVFTLEYRPDFQRVPQLTRVVLEAVRTIDPCVNGRSNADGGFDMRHSA